MSNTILSQVATKKIMFRKARILVFVGALLYPMALLWSYRNIVVPHFAYMGYAYEPSPSVLFWIVSMGLILFPAFFLAIEVSRPSQVFCWILYLTVYIPTLLLPTVLGRLHPIRILQLDSIMLLSFLVLILCSTFPLLRLPRINLTPNEFWLAVLTLSALSFAYIFSRFGLPTSLPNLTSVYDVRMDYRDELSSGGRLVAYVINAQSKVINPLIIGYGLVNRRIVLTIVGIAGQMAIYSSTGFKSVLFSAMLILVLLVCLKNSGKWFGNLILFGMTISIVLMTIFDLARGTINLTSLFVRRFIVTPGLLTGQYFEFFDQNPKAHLAGSIFARFFDYPYDRPIPFVVGYNFTGNENLSANANLWADAFSNFGIPGMLIFTILLGLIVWVLDSAAFGRDNRLTTSFAGLAAISLGSSALLTSLLTHGILLGIILIYLMPQSQIVGPLQKNSADDGN